MESFPVERSPNQTGVPLRLHASRVVLIAWVSDAFHLEPTQQRQLFESSPEDFFRLDSYPFVPLSTLFLIVLNAID